MQLVLDPLRRFVGWVRTTFWRWQPARVARTWRWGRAFASALAARRRATGLTVAVDVTALWGRRTGIGWYLHSLLDELGQRDDLQLRLYGPELFIHPNDEDAWDTVPQGPAITHVFLRIPDDLTISRDTLLRVLRALEPRIIAADRSRVVFAPNFVPPDKFRRARGALVVTVHDLSFRLVSWSLHDETRRSLEARLEQAVARARLVLTDSEAVRGELIAHGTCVADVLLAIPLGPGHVTSTMAALLPDGIPERFALHVGTLEPRKNLAMLLRAWEQLHAGRRGLLPLVLCGAAGWKNDDLHPMIARGVSEGWLISCGYVSQAALAGLYRSAVLVCCPSLYEGFGLPVLEAMGAGTPVLASDIPVHREIAGDAAILLPSEDPARWAEAAAALAEDDGRRRELSERGRLRAGEFSWRRTADATAAALAAAAQTGPR